eukprot:NODE_2760_length_1126_cov_24.515320_g2535_i0.p1 GENE.NODE_2760_length_1126_cov_24.515320_g2535_i0~~NODE_2760_length_1126_cov_24.515320_g2535_i0.p1  ORF type:complete len:185 (-),score=16.88 NODE_2760_length_1126_cov_24.515320_g2535_i0:487-1041(-)
MSRLTFHYAMRAPEMLARSSSCERDFVCTACHHIRHFNEFAFGAFLQRIKCLCGARGHWSLLRDRSRLGQCPLVTRQSVTDCHCKMPGRVCKDDLLCTNCRVVTHAKKFWKIFAKCKGCGGRGRWENLQASTACPRRWAGDLERIMCLWAWGKGHGLRQLPPELIEIIISYFENEWKSTKPALE